MKCDRFFAQLPSIRSGCVRSGEASTRIASPDNVDTTAPPENCLMTPQPPHHNPNFPDPTSNTASVPTAASLGQAQPSVSTPSRAFGAWAKVKDVLLMGMLLPRKHPHSFSDDEVRAKAHQLWLKRGEGSGGEERDWQQAIERLQWEQSPIGRTLKLFQLAWSADNTKDAIEVLKMGISALGLIATVGAVIGLAINYQQSQERLITERFAKSVEQLGSQDSSVRIGAIYSLERIAKDSPKDYWTVMEVLSAYVREHSKLPGEWVIKPEDLPNVTTDVQSAVTVIGRRNLGNNPQGQQIDLFFSNLTGANLNGANLNGASLYGADLNGAILLDAKLQGTSFTGSYLGSAVLYRADLTDAHLAGVKLQWSDLSHANLQKAFLREAELQGAFLNEANLSGAKDLTRKQLKDTYLCSTRLPDDLKDLSNHNCKEDRFEWRTKLQQSQKHQQTQ